MRLLRETRQRRLILPTLLLAALLSGRPASAYQIIMDYNTFQVRDGIENTPRLACDGAWCILQNSDLDNAQWKTVLANTGTRAVFAEDNPGPHNVGQAPGNNRARVQTILGRVDATLCYNETGAQPGGTLLSDAQVELDAANHGGQVIVLTRAYSLRPGDAWRQNVDRCLANPKVCGVAMETVGPYDRQGCDLLLSTALQRYHKPVYFLLPSSKEAYLAASIRFLQERQPALLRDPRVFIVVCPYQTPGTPWFGPGPDSAEGTVALLRRWQHPPAVPSL